MFGASSIKNDVPTSSFATGTGGVTNNSELQKLTAQADPEARQGIAVPVGSGKPGSVGFSPLQAVSPGSLPPQLAKTPVLASPKDAQTAAALKNKDPALASLLSKAGNVLNHNRDMFAKIAIDGRQNVYIVDTAPQAGGRMQVLCQIKPNGYPSIPGDKNFVPPQVGGPDSKSSQGASGGAAAKAGVNIPAAVNSRTGSVTLGKVTYTRNGAAPLKPTPAAQSGAGSVKANGNGTWTKDDWKPSLPSQGRAPSMPTLPGNSGGYGPRDLGLDTSHQGDLMQPSWNPLDGGIDQTTFSKGRLGEKPLLPADATALSAAPSSRTAGNAPLNIAASVAARDPDSMPTADDLKAKDEAVETFGDAGFKGYTPDFQQENQLSVKGTGGNTIGYNDYNKNEACLYLGVDTTKADHATFGAKDWQGFSAAKVTFQTGKMSIELSNGQKATVDGKVAASRTKDAQGNWQVNVTFGGKTLQEIFGGTVGNKPLQDPSRQK